MTERISILTKAYTYSEYAEEGADFAVIYLSEEDIEEITRLVPIIKENNLRSGTSWALGDVGFYPYPVEGCDLHATDKVPADDLLGFADELSDEEDYIATDGAVLHVRGDGTFFFVDFQKHSDVKMESEEISIEIVNKALKMSLEEAPKFLKDENTILSSRAAQLLAKGE